MPELEDLAPQITKLIKELDRRTRLVRVNESYIDACAPVPQAVETARMSKAYKVLMPMAGAPWASLVVDSVQDRLEVGGIRTGDDRTDKEIWSEAWQANALDAMAKLGHNGVLANGRCFATIWPDAAGEPEIVLDGADQMVVQYQEGRHQPRHRIAALRRWKDDDDRLHLTIYTAAALYKLQEAKESTASKDRVSAAGTFWERREEVGRDGQPEPWPLVNPFGVVPVVEIATNRRLKAGSFAYARGEFEHHIGLLDRIHLLTFVGLVIAVWMGFPLRGVIGDKILRDDDGVALPPFQARPDSVVQFEDPAAKVFQLDAADRKNLSIFPELAQLAYSTKTPAHYFPMDGGMSNISADMIRALEGGLHAKVSGIHQPFIGEGWEEVLRVAGLMMSPVIEIPSTAAVWWLDHESRSMAERADAALKVGTLGFPPLFIAEKYLNFNAEEIGRVQAMKMDDALTKLFDAATAPPVEETLAPDAAPVA